MIEIIDILLAVLPLIGAISFIAFFFLGLNYKLQNIESKIFNYLEESIYFRAFAIITIISFISVFSLSAYVSKLSRTEIVNKIENLDDSSFKLFINDTLKKNDSLIVTLRKIKKQTSNRNTGSKEISIKIQNGNEKINLKLLRDYENQTKYWVFYENYETTSKNCVGEINTNCLTEYKSR